MLLLVALASAQTPVALRELALGVGLGGEAVLQGGLVDAYPTLGTGLGVEVGASAALSVPVELSLEVGYRRADGVRRDGSGSWIWYLPVSGLVSGRLDLGTVSLLGGLGPSIVVWQEEGSPEALPGRQDWGARWGLLGEVSVRWHTSFVREPLYAETRTSRGLDLYVSVGSRVSDVADAASAATCAEEPCGFDWSAVRLGAGALFRF